MKALEITIICVTLIIISLIARSVIKTSSMQFTDPLAQQIQAIVGKEAHSDIEKQLVKILLEKQTRKE